jgi:hypothetical protein
MPAATNVLSTLLLAGLIGLALYFRFRRTFGRQPVAPRRMAFRIALLLLVAGVTLARAPNLSNVMGALSGALAGGILAFVGLATTRFTFEGESRFYTPNPWIGLGVTALFLGRLAARFLHLKDAMAKEGGADTFAAMNRSPLTVATFFVLATYFVVYFAGVLRKARGF